MATPLQAARRARDWSQARTVWQLTRLAAQRGVKVASAASLKTELSRWENGHVTPGYYQGLLCELFRLSAAELGFGTQDLPSTSSPHDTSDAVLIAKPVWTRDDIAELTRSFDSAMSRASAADVELLAHEWLAADTPQRIELRAGRKVGESLIAAAEHRVMQLRRADDFMSGRTSYALVQQELRATARTLNEAALTEDQAGRLLTVVGELAQLAAWVAADAGLYKVASTYVSGGVTAAHAARNAPLAANIISTLSYQIANTGNPRQAALLARTAYAGARHDASATTKALLLERVAWADAKSDDRVSCMRALGQVDERFDNACPDEDPDWVYWLSRQEIEVMAGRCLTEIKEPAQAESLLRKATATYSDARVRENSLYLSWLAEDYIQLNEIEQACDVVSKVFELAIRADSARTDERLRHLARLLASRKDIPAVAQFLDQYRELGQLRR
jgi:tetratricopeptide (TPR) repeat protein